MNNYLSGFLIRLAVFALAVAELYAGAPPINIMVSDSTGRVVFKGTAAANGTFATGNLQPGNYVVQFTSNGSPPKGIHYAIIVSSASAKASANDIDGERLAGAGVAMKIAVGIPINETLKKNPGLNNPAAMRAMERGNKEGGNIAGQVSVKR